MKPGAPLVPSTLSNGEILPNRGLSAGTRRWNSTLRQRKPLKRSTPMARVNKRRRFRLHARNFGEYANIIRALPCARCGQRVGIQAAHAIPRSRGGDRTVLFPACARCHEWIDAHPLERKARYLPVAIALWETLGKGEPCG